MVIFTNFAMRPLQHYYDASWSYPVLSGEVCTLTASQNKAGPRLAKRFCWKSGVKARFIHNVTKLLGIIR